MALSYLKLFYDFQEEIELLDMEERGRLLTAMLIYGSTGQTPEGLLTGNERILFPVCRQRIDRDAGEYERKAEANRANGLKGGRPRKNPLGFSETQKSQEEEKEKNKEKDKEEDQEKGEEKDNRGEVPSGRTAAPIPAPSLDQVIALGKMIAQSVDPERFWNHYQANGWRSNGVPIRDWKAMLRQWELENRANPAALRPRASPAPSPAPDPAMNYTQREYRPEDFPDGFYING